VVVTVGETLWDPAVAVEPVHGALHEVTLLLVQLSVEEPPTMMDGGVATRETLGVPVTVTVAFALTGVVPSVHVTV
jgi:hypothetical protein